MKGSRQGNGGGSDGAWPPPPPNANAPSGGHQRQQGGGGLQQERGGRLLLGSSEEEREREQEQEEYTFHHHYQQRPPSRASDSASIHFLTDDRLQRQSEESGGGGQRGQQQGRGGAELLAEDVAQIRLSEQLGPSTRVPSSRHHPTVEQQSGAGRMAAANGQVDYSPGDFRRAKAAIEDAAARQQHQRGPGLKRVKQIGDTTVITEHRDPYSFYWQLDKLKKAEQEQPRPAPPVDYVLEEEEEEHREEEEEELPKQQFLSPDSGVHLVERERDELEEEEQAYARPVKITTEDPAVFSHYWHVDSGPRAKEPPPRRRPPLPRAEPVAVISPPPPPPIEQPIREPVIEEHAFRQTTTKRRMELAEDEMEEGGGDGHGKPVSFKARWLGQLELDNAELEGGERKSQAALNRAMAKLGGNAGKEVRLEIGGGELRILDAETEGKEPLLRVPVPKIQCWAVGRDNWRDFAFVARPSDGRPPLCHVFRCEESAKAVAEALGHACNRLLQQQQQGRRRPDSLGGGSLGRKTTRQSVPVSPIQEPKRVVRCHFVGVTQVPRATGIETLNEAVDRLLAEVCHENWKPTLVDAHISPSSIAIFEATGTRRQIASCRVRYLSFLGIGRDVKHCAFIVAQSADHFVCYVFHAEPSAAPLAKTIEAACKLRYQKVLDAHLGNLDGMPAPSMNGWGKQHKSHHSS